MEHDIYSPVGVKALLKHYGKPVKKSLGQHYLIHPSVPTKIARLTAKLKQNHLAKAVFEIGPGLGALTHCLLGEKLCVKAVEIDRLSLDILRDQFKTEIKKGFLHLIAADFLTLPSLPAEETNLIMTGNLPYQITSAVLFKCMEGLRSQLKHLIFMMQKEVAHRIISAPHSRSYGQLSVFCQYYFSSIKRVALVHPSHFYPAPKVTSEVLHFVFRETPSHLEDPLIFKMMIKSAFMQRRKKISKAIRTSSLFEFCEPLLDGLWSVYPEQADKRAENLTAADFVLLANTYVGLRKDQ